MVDTLVETLVAAGLNESQGLWGPYWADEDTAAIIFSDSGNDLNYAYTIDGGATWATTQIAAGTGLQLACWFDKETPGDTGTLVHIAWIDLTGADSVFYITLDVSDEALGTKRTVDSTITGPGVFSEARIAITKAVNGNLMVAFTTQVDLECYRSTDGGAVWTDRADVFETATEEDWVLLFPANVDDGDVCALFWDRSASELSVKMYDDSLNTWTETSISGSMSADPLDIHMDGAVRHSDNHLLVAAHSAADTAGDDLLTWDITVDSIAAPTVTAKTNIFTDTDFRAQAAMFIDQQSDDVYVAHLKGPVWKADVDVVYNKSPDDMGSWDAESAYSENAADDVRRVQAGRTVGDDGGRYQPSFYNTDITDIFVNETNDVLIEVAAPAPAVATPFPVHDFSVVRVPGRGVAY